MQRLSSYDKNMIVHDTRLGGNPPLGYARNIYKVDGTVSTNHIFDWVASHAADVGGLSRLYIMCHGYAGADGVGQRSADVGGQGLQLGANSVTLNNVIPLATKIRGKVGRIIIYSCGAADDSLAAGNLFADGQRLMTELSTNSGAFVVAADRIQWYNRISVMTPFSYIGGVGDDDMIDFGTWEGTVYEFSPNPAVSPRIFTP